MGNCTWCEEQIDKSCREARRKVIREIRRHALILVLVSAVMQLLLRLLPV